MQYTYYNSLEYPTQSFSLNNLPIEIKEILNAIKTNSLDFVIRGGSAISVFENKPKHIQHDMDLIATSQDKHLWLNKITKYAGHYFFNNQNIHNKEVLTLFLPVQDSTYYYQIDVRFHDQLPISVILNNAPSGLECYNFVSPYYMLFERIKKMSSLIDVSGVDERINKHSNYLQRISSILLSNNNHFKISNNDLKYIASEFQFLTKE